MANGDTRTILSKDTLVPVGFILAIVGAAVSFGMVIQRVNAVEADVQKTNADQRITKLEVYIPQILSSLEEIKTDIKQIRKVR